MELEIERRFLFDPRLAPEASRSLQLRQAYLSVDPEVRVRSSLSGSTITVKTGSGIARGEWEYRIPASDAADLMSLTPWSVVEKVRGVAEFAGSEWLLDIYLGKNTGLCVAEVELSDPQQDVLIPPWVSKEVTDDYRYHPSFLARFPYVEWR